MVTDRRVVFLDHNGVPGEALKTVYDAWAFGKIHVALEGESTEQAELEGQKLHGKLRDCS